MNGRSDADARCDAQHLGELHGLLDWIRAVLLPKREAGALLPWEADLLRRVEAIGEM